MTQTIAGTYSTLVTLGAAIDNPTTITVAARLNDGLLVSYTDLTVLNAGRIAAAGVTFTAGGSVTNQSGGAISGNFGIYAATDAVTVINAGSITGSSKGVYLLAGGSVTNQSGGTISGDHGIYGYRAPLTVVNAGSIAGAGAAIVLSEGGSVTNQSGGLISGLDGISGADTVVNAGSIAGNTTDGSGVAIVVGGSVTNQSGGAISGYNGIGGLFAAATVVNAGSIAGSTDGVRLFWGGSVTNQSGGSISGRYGVFGGGGVFGTAMTVVNAGTITGSSDAVKFAAGYANWLVIDPDAVFSGAVTGGNAIGAAQVSTLELASVGSAGTLTGLGTQFVDFAQVIVDAGAQWTLTGTNTLAAGSTLTNGGTLTDAGSLTNAGTFSGPLTLASGGMLSNAATGTITAPGGAAVYGTTGGAATVVNAGVIADTDASGGRGIDLLAGGSVTNQSGGVISGYRGVEGLFDAVTVTNAGTIASDLAPAEGLGVSFFDSPGTLTNQSGGTISGGFEAVSFAAGYHGLLVVDPGAVFIGTVTGGNTAGAATVTTLELAAGADPGTLTGLGTQFVDFVQSTIDSGASWTFTGSNTIGANYTLTNDGTLTNTGTLTNNGTLFDNGVMLNSGAATLSGPLIVAGTLDNAGGITVARYRALQLSPSGYLYNEVSGYIGRTGVGARFNPVVFAVTGGDSTIRNLGTIKNATGDFTVYLAAGGTITNGSVSDTTALIYGAVPIYVYSGRGTVTNFGTIQSNPTSNGAAIELNHGGIVINGASGSTTASILGQQYGVFAVNGPTTLINFGTIAATSDNGSGFYQRSGTATIINAGMIDGGDGLGVDLEDGGTIIDSGAIAGGNTSIRFGGTGSNLLVLEQGYELFGMVQGSASASNTLELVGSVGAAVTVNYRIGEIGGLVNFQTVEFGPGAGNTATLILPSDTKLPGTIAGFTGVHDTIDLTGLSDTGYDATTSFNSLTDVLTVTGDNGSVQLQLDKGEDYADIAWLAQNDGNGGTSIHVENVVPLVISGTTPGQTITDEETDRPFSGISITDPNAPIGTDTVTITLTSGGIPTDADGTLSGTGLTKTGIGTYTLFAGNAAEATTELQALVFTPTEHQVAPGDSITTTFTVAAIDAVGVTATDSTTTVTATAVNDPPTVTPSSGNTGVPNQTPNSPFTDLTVNDPDVGHVDTVTVTLSDAGGGVLSNLDGGSYDAATGVYTVTGTAANVTAALQGLVFTPTPPASGYVSTTSFTVAVTGPGGSATDSSISVTSVQQVLGLAGTPNSQDVISVSPDGTGFAPATPGKSNQAIVSDPSANASYTLPTGYQAAFLGGSAGAMLTDPSGGNALLVGNSGNDTITAGAANDTILGGSGNNTMSVAGANDLILATGGFSVIDVTGLNAGVLGGGGTISAAVSGNNATLSAGLSTASVTISGSHAAILGGTATNAGAFNITDNGANNTIAAFAANASIATYGSDALIFGGTGTSNVTLSGASDTLAGGASNETVSATGNALDFAGTGALDFVAGAGTATIVGNSGGPEQITAGSGGVLFAAQMNTAATITAGSGDSTVFGGSGSVVTYVGSLAGATFVAGQGNETLTAASSSTANFFSGGAYAGSNVLMVGGSGADTMLAGLGSDTMTGGAGSNAFAFFAANTGGAHDYITDFNANDAVYLIGYDPAQTASTLQDAATVTASGVTLTLSDNTQITFTDLSNVQALDGHILYVGGTGSV